MIMLSRLANKTGHHFLVAGLVKGDFQLVTINMDDVAHAEFLVENTLAIGKFSFVAVRGKAAFCICCLTFGHTPPARPVPAAHIATAGKCRPARQLRLRRAAKGNGPAKPLRHILDYGFRRQFLHET